MLPAMPKVLVNFWGFGRICMENQFGSWKTNFGFDHLTAHQLQGYVLMGERDLMFLWFMHGAHCVCITSSVTNKNFNRKKG